MCCIFTLPFIYKKILNISIQEIKYLLLAGFLNGTSMFLLFTGLSKSSPALVSMLNRSYIVFSILIAALVLKEKISKIDWWLIIFAGVGIILFLFKKDMAQIPMGSLYGLASGLLFALCNLTIKNKLTQTSEYIILFSLNFITAIIFLVICLKMGTHFLALPLEVRTISLVFLGSFIGSFLGLLLFYISIKTIPFYKANLYRSLSPVVSLSFGLYFFPVTLTNLNIGGLFILLGAFIIHSFIKVKTMKTNSTKLTEIETVKTDILPDSHKSVLVFIKEGNTWLMVKNKFRNWEFPGGHKENDESVFETATREAYEEAGVEIKNLKYFGFYRLLCGHTTLVVTAEVEKFHEIPVEFETEERKFVDKLPEVLSFDDGVYAWLVGELVG